MIGLVRDRSYRVVNKLFNPSMDWMKDQLEKNVCLVLFKKKLNGQYRSMKCTRNLSKLPRNRKTMISTIENPHGYDNIITVWEVESREWKSFYYESVHSFTVLLETLEKK